MISFGISTWSIHRTLEQGSLDLLDVPPAVRAHDMTDLQICHFHLKSRDRDYVDQLRRCIEAEGVTLDALLLDFGDISHPTRSAQDAAELESWLATAGELGTRYARISAGAQQPDDVTLARSAENLLRLSKVGRRHGVTVVTENWHAMMPTSSQVNRLHELTDGAIPLCLDFGNWSGPAKYAELSAVATQAVTIHAKCGFDAAGNPDAQDFARCLEVLKTAGYTGTIALIYDGPSADEWRAINVELKLARVTV